MQETIYNYEYQVEHKVRRPQEIGEKFSYRLPTVPYLDYNISDSGHLQQHDFQEQSSLETAETVIKEDTEKLIDAEKKPFVLFFVLDDAGQFLDQIEPYVHFEGKTTIAILPNTGNATLIAQRLQIYNVPYMLHLPMEPIGEQNPGENAIKVVYSNEKIKELLNTNLQSISGIIGVNNHMGSLATSDERVMRLVLSAVLEKDLFFLDSKTTANTVTKKLARELNMNVIARDVFIDNINNVKIIKERIHEGIAIAKHKGHAVLIGHVTREETFKAISELYPYIIEEGGILAGLDEYSKYVEI